MSKTKFKFKVGDRVRIRQWYDMAKEFEITPSGNIRPSFSSTIFNPIMRELCGRIAKITYICDDTVKLDFDDKTGRFMWTYKTWMIEPLKNETIVIYRKGQEVIALDKTTGKKAVAKCSPDDEFDFNVGAKLAFERLMDDGKAEQVNRMANVNEYIKIIRPVLAFGRYKIDDIIRVTEIKGNTVKGFNLNTKECCVGLCKEEYVVLEGYEPPKEEATTKFLEKFEEGKIYVFRKELHDKRCPFCKGNTWTEKCDGKIVDVRGEIEGGVGTYTVVPSWCEEIGYVKEK